MGQNYEQKILLAKTLVNVPCTCVFLHTMVNVTFSFSATKMVVFIVKPFQIDQFCTWWLLVVTLHSVAGMALNGFKNECKAIPLVKIDFTSNAKQEQEPKQGDIQSLNDHLSPKIGPTEIRSQIPYPQSITNEMQSSVIFKEVSTLILKKASYKVISYMNFQPHIKTFEDTGKLLTDTHFKIMSHLQVSPKLPRS